MGQHSSKTSSGIYFRKIPPLFSVKNHINNNEKLHEPTAFQYQLTRCNKRKSGNKSKNRDNLGFNTLKNVLGGVKSECSSLKNCSNGDYKTHFLSSDKESCHFSSLKISHVINKEGKQDRKHQEDGFRMQEPPSRTNSEPNLRGQRGRGRIKSRQSNEEFWERKTDRFGYEIQNIDEFLSKATLSRPANIPVVLAFPSILYETRSTGYQNEISLPLGMVVNAIFRNQNWLYVQTPHAEEGYIAYSACLPLGIIHPPGDDQCSPCWERSTDIFPKPFGNHNTGTTNSELASCRSGNDDDYSYCPGAKYRTALSTCGEKSVDRLYLRAAAMAKGKGTRRTLLVINEDFKARGKESISVKKNEVVFLIHGKIQGWFFIKNKEGEAGYIPSIIAGHGFL